MKRLLSGSNPLIYLIIILIGGLISSSSQYEVCKFNGNKLEIQNGMLVQMDIDELRKEYPELMNFLYNTSNDRPRMNEENFETTTQATTTRKKSFIYYNATTKKLEGISMQSTYSIFKLNPYKIFTVVTTTSFPLYTPVSKTSRRILKHGTAALIPLYHQFIYSINIFNYLPSDNKVTDLGNLLNEQTIEASRYRVHILKAISSRLNINPSSLRINWIEKLNANSGEVNQTDSPYEKILISLSNTDLLDMQNSYSRVIGNNEPDEANELSFAYQKECSKYFTYLSTLHQKKELNFNINFLPLIYPNESFFTNNNQNQDYERVEKVQLLKLCNIKSIYSILSLSDKIKNELKSDNKNLPNRLLPKQLKLANTLIKKSTEEILFEQEPVEIDYLLEDSMVNSTTDDLEYNDYSKVISLKSDNQNASTTTIEQPQNNFTINLYPSFNYIEVSNQSMNSTWYDEVNAQIQTWFWAIVPAEDILVAVIVPIIIIISLIVFTVVSVCILQMCNKDYKDAKKISSVSNATEISAVQPLNDKASRTPAIFKERAYLSKGVPVILYEEMSYKPIDDYDENHREIMDNGFETRNYRSPLIMRNEKPPMPAPPEYSRANFLSNNNNNLGKDFDHVIVNELNEESAMLIVNKNKRSVKNNAANNKDAQARNSISFKPLDSINENSFNL